MPAFVRRVDAVLIQAVIAAALSFAHLHDIASAAGQNGWKAWAYPVSVDLLLVAAWRRLRSGSSRAAGWCWFVIALTASLGANVATAGLLDVHAVPAWLRILVAGWPAIGFLGGTLLAHTAPATEPGEAAAARPEPIEPEPVPVEPPAVEPVQPAEPAEPVELVRPVAPEPEGPASAPPLPPAPNPASAPAPALVAPPVAPTPTPVPVPAALVAHARKLAADHHTRTGSPIDTATLRARLGVPVPVAEAVAAQL